MQRWAFILCLSLTLLPFWVSANFDQTKTECEAEKQNEALTTEVCDLIAGYRTIVVHTADLTGLFSINHLYLMIEPKAASSRFADKELRQIENTFATRGSFDSRAGLFDIDLFKSVLARTLGIQSDLRKKHLEAEKLELKDFSMRSSKARYWTVSAMIGARKGSVSLAYDETSLGSSIYQRLVSSVSMGTPPVITWVASCADSTNLYFVCPFKESVRERVGGYFSSLLRRPLDTNETNLYRAISPVRSGASFVVEGHKTISGPY
ncbi:hypothetical protein EOPP23_08095 [Endozoicomonas sp. OPT23]|uniref:hypothetical protein n=1 Tax=Endozoicomonas sp. OPT23 TaxID=2072845 RepID=UPI00129A13EC|nr:hypothetical protein [Endozoicomonas sp. OPT23]MRI32944.1 hypothetical protein [Endozoicomonas sp. OPT23]